MRKDLDKLFKKQMKLGYKLIKLSNQIEMEMTFEKTWQLSSNIEQVAYDLSRAIREFNEQLS
jgi:hypothetical protein